MCRNNEQPMRTSPEIEATEYLDMYPSNLHTFFQRTSIPEMYMVTLSILVVLFKFYFGLEIPMQVVHFIFFPSFAGHFGIQVWMCGINGPILYNAVPLHYFAKVQTVLFPVYFSVCTICTFNSLIAFILWNEEKMFEGQTYYQVLALIGVLLLELIVRWAFVKKFICTYNRKMQIESEYRCGHEIGQPTSQKLRNDENYKIAKKEKDLAHRKIVICTVISFVCYSYVAYNMINSFSKQFQQIEQTQQY